MQHNKLFEQKGLVNILTLVGVIIVSLTLPVVTKLVQDNQENRSQAVLVEGGTLSECTKSGFPDTCLNGVLKYCNTLGKKSTLTCKYGCRLDKKACATAPVTPTCVYTYGSWSECDPATRTQKRQESKSPSTCTGGTRQDTSRSCKPKCSGYNYNGGWTPCSSGGRQSATYNGYTPNNCTGIPSDAPKTRLCTPPLVTCTSFTYTKSACVNGNRTLTIATKSPSNCTGGNPKTSESCCENETYRCSGNRLEWCNDPSWVLAKDCGTNGCDNVKKECKPAQASIKTSTPKPKCVSVGGFCSSLSCSSGVFYTPGQSDCIGQFCCKPNSANQNLENNSEVNNQDKKTIDEEISILCNLEDKRCNGNNLEICKKNELETQIGLWTLIERCQYGCDSKFLWCKASCGISEFMSNNMSGRPEVGLCKAGVVSGFDSETDNNSWVWNCGGNNLASVHCEAKRKLLKIVLSETSLILEEGKNKKITTKLDPSDKNEKINWQSGDGLVATVSSDGLITAVGTGVVKIKVSTTKNRSAEVNVTVIANTEKCFANEKNYNNGEAYCSSQNGKLLMVCEYGKLVSKECKYGCSDNKCRADCGIDIFYSFGKKDNPSESVLCDLGKPVDFDSEINVNGSVNDWKWKCKGEDLTTVVCRARRAVYCDSLGGICVNNSTACDREYNGRAISGADDCQKKAMICCKENTQIKIKKITISRFDTLVVGVKKQIEYSVEPNNATEKILWTSSNPNVVKVDLYSGIIEAVSPGVSQITATAIGVDKQILSVSVVANEDEICSKSNCGLCKTKINCLMTDKCFWKNSECLLPSENDQKFCQGKSGYYCNDIGERIECRQNQLISQVDNDAKCLAEMGCNSNTLGKYSCRDGNLRYQCIEGSGFSRFQWVSLGKCEFGCSKLGECLGGYKCDGQWSEKYDGNGKQVGSGANCNYGCDSKSGKCLCGYGPGEDQKRVIGEYACFDNAEFICGENGFFKKKRDCSRCGEDRCLEYNNENKNEVIEYEYKCEKSILGFLGNSLSVKYIKGSNQIVGEKVLCQWGCENGKCQCKDNWGVKKKNGEKTCVNNAGYKCVDGSWRFEKKCFECKENGECLQSNETNKTSQCEASGGVCVKDTLSCESGKVISSIMSCSDNNPICCWQKDIKTVTGITKLDQCETLNTMWPVDFKEMVDHGDIRCDEKRKNLEICDNGIMRHYSNCWSNKCWNGKCVN